MYFWETRNGGGQIELKLFGIEEKILFDRPWWKKVYLIAKGFWKPEDVYFYDGNSVAVYDVSVVLKLEYTNRSSLCQKLVNKDPRQLIFIPSLSVMEN